MSRLITATDFSILTDETIDVSVRTELATFVRYIDSDSNDVKEEFLGQVQIKGNKDAAQICGKISELFHDKGTELSNMQFSGLDGTNSMSGEITGLQQQLHHLSPHMKYIKLQSYVKKYSPLPRFQETFKIIFIDTPSTANMERGFAVLTMLLTKYHNSLLPNSLDELM